MPLIKREPGNGDRTPIIRSSPSNSCVGTATTKSPGKKAGTSKKAESRTEQMLKANASGRTASAIKSSATIKPKQTRKVSAPTVQKAKSATKKAAVKKAIANKTAAKSPAKRANAGVKSQSLIIKGRVSNSLVITSPVTKSPLAKPLAKSLAKSPVAKSSLAVIRAIRKVGAVVSPKSPALNKKTMSKLIASKATPRKVEKTSGKVKKAPSKAKRTPGKVQKTPGKVQKTPGKVQKTPGKANKVTPQKATSSIVKRVRFDKTAIDNAATSSKVTGKFPHTVQ